MYWFLHEMKYLKKPIQNKDHADFGTPLAVIGVEMSVSSRL